MSAARGYFSPYYVSSLHASEAAVTVIREGFSPRERKCGACSSPFTTTPLRSYFCLTCWIYVRRDYCPNGA